MRATCPQRLLSNNGRSEIFCPAPSLSSSCWKYLHESHLLRFVVLVIGFTLDLLHPVAYCSHRNRRSVHVHRDNQHCRERKQRVDATVELSTYHTNVLVRICTWSMAPAQNSKSQHAHERCHTEANNASRDRARPAYGVPSPAWSRGHTHKHTAKPKKKTTACRINRTQHCCR